MKLPCGFFLLWFGLVGSLAESDPSLKGEESYSDWGLRHLRGSFESVNSYVDSFMELLGGKNGVCQYRCRYGEYPGAFSGVGVGVGEGVGSWTARQVTSVLHQVGQVTRLSKSGVVTSEIQADNKFLRGAWDTIWDLYLPINYALTETQAPLSLGVFEEAFYGFAGSLGLKGR